jgi:hypothetical protein
MHEQTTSYSRISEPFGSQISDKNAPAIVKLRISGRTLV